MRQCEKYFRKPRSEIVKDVLSLAALTGIICIAATSPYFIVNILKSYNRFRKYKKEKIQDAFYNLRKQGDIEIIKKNHQIYISLTNKGKKRAKWLQINNLKIKRPNKWDKKWRIVIFDIAQLKRFYREAFRGKLKELDFQPLQKSVWVCPFDCRKEVSLLKNFFGLSDKEARLIIAEKIGDDSYFKKSFKIV
ncbi:MAG: phenylacetic acid degradation operon negative regulatory protein [Parcubacteria group bacterium Licking1014_1]|nr:MAG: phenylacetic acid degradation operon negative regulatory protein [Parcubacteria group bacterium Licking1014_1]